MPLADKAVHGNSVCLKLVSLSMGTVYVHSCKSGNGNSVCP